MNNTLVPPHLNAEVYRTNTAGTDSSSHLDYIKINTDGTVLVGSSELTGRYWNGGANIFKKISEARNGQTHAKHIDLVSGTNDGCFIGAPNKIFLCEDNGSVSIWTSGDEAWKQWVEELSVAEHDGGVLGVDCLNPGQEYVTVGADGNVKVWDIVDLICIKNYSASNNLPIYGLSVRPGTKTSFATGSADQFITLWDDNEKNSVLDVVHNDCGIRCLQWLDENRILYGDEAGALSIVDVRNHQATSKVAEFPAAVHRISINSRSKKVAVCCDNKIVSVCNISDDDTTKIVYKDSHLHNNYVRGIAWDADEQDLLHSVGWDGTIKTHSVQ